MKLSYLFITTVLFMGATMPVLANNEHHTSHDESAQPGVEENVQATGEIKGIDLTANKISISHDPIPALGWPAMTMRFTAQDLNLITPLHVGDRVEFNFIQQGNISLLRSIKVVN